MKEGRDLDVIIIGDASAGITDKYRGMPQELFNFFKKVIPYGISYDLDRDIIPSQEKYITSATPNFLVYRPKPISQSGKKWIHRNKLPMLIYFNFTKNDDLINDPKNEELSLLVESHKLKSFDLPKVLRDFGETFSFEYDSSEFERLAALAEFNIRIRKDTLLAILKKEQESAGPLR